jgi:(p)ppGpp synthase/HD superfamily hydrolase
MWGRKEMKDNFEDALQFAMTAHRGQLDNGWTPYIQHLIGVWSRVRYESLTTQIVALLHDSVEDTNVTVPDIRRAFGEEVADAVLILTHTGSVKYDAYIQNIISHGNRHAIAVKIADLEDNSSDIRLQRLPEKKREYFRKRIAEKYLPAKHRLQQALEAL